MGKKFSVKSIGKWLSENIIIVLIFLASVFVSTQNKNFLSANNIRNLLSNTAVRFIIACGVSGCLITKGTDLSAGRVAGLAACLSGILMQRANYDQRFYPGMPEMPLLVVLLIVVALCALIGAVNGSVIAFLKVPPFIATLGMQTLVYGACLVYTGAIPIGGLRSDYTGLATGYVGTRMLSNLTIIAIFIGLFMWFLYNKTRYGKYMYAIGGNATSANLMGISTRSATIRIYMLSTGLATLAGIVFSIYTQAGYALAGVGVELDAIASVVIGGTLLSGGVGTVLGTLFGVAIQGLIQTYINFDGTLSSWWTKIAIGILLFIFIALQRGLTVLWENRQNAAVTRVSGAGSR